MRESPAFLLALCGLLAFASVCTMDAFVAPLIVVVVVMFAIHGFPGRRRMP